MGTFFGHLIRKNFILTQNPLGHFESILVLIDNHPVSNIFRFLQK